VALNSVGEAAVDIVANTQNFEKDLTNEVSNAAKAAEPAAEKGGTGIGDALGRGLIATGKIVGAGLAAALGASLVAGFNRLKVIDQAEAKLLGLGNSAEEVVGIMDQALKAVEGTAFGLGDAADLAARFMAAGVEAGGDLQLALDATTDAASITGMSLADMGEIMGDIAADGELTGASLRRMSQAGIDAVDQLADAYGVTREEAQRMVDDGEVSFEMFAQAMEKNIGDASEKSGDTFTGAMKNIGAAMARLGATILKPVFDAIIAISPLVIAAIDLFTDAFRPIFEEIGPAVEQAFQKIAAALSNIDWAAVGVAVGEMVNVIVTAIQVALPIIAKLIDVFGPPLQLAIKAVTAALIAMPWDAIAAAIERLGPIILVVLTAFGGFKKVQGLMALTSKAVSGVSSAIIGMGAGFKGATVPIIANTTATKTNTIALKLHAVATKISAAATKAFGAAMKFLSGPIGWVTIAIAALVAGLIYFFTQTERGQEIWAAFVVALQETWASFVAWIVPILQRLGQFIVQVWQLITAIVVPIVTALVTILAALWQRFVAVVVPILQFVGQFIVAVWQLIVSIVVPIVTTFIEVLIEKFNAFVAFWGPIWEQVKQVITTVWDIIVAVVIPIVTMLIDFIRARTEALLAFWGPIWDKIKQIVETVWNIITGAIQAAVALIVAIMNGDMASVVEIINGIWEDVKAGTQRIWDSIVAWIRDIPQKIKDIFSDARSWLVDAGRNILQGLWDGLKSIWGSIESWFSDKINGLVAKAQDLLSIGSPSKVFHEMGEQVAQGFINGVEGMAKDIEATANVFAKPAHALTTGPGSITSGPATTTAAPGTTAGATTTFAEGAVQVNGVQDAYKAALLAVNGIAERVAL
jgi:tape measure domain-containing protein